VTRKRRELTEDEAHLWRRVASTLKQRRALLQAKAPTAPAERALVKPPKTPPPPKSSAQAPPKPAAERLPADHGGERRVRRGRVEVEATLDLHGHTQDSASAALSAFLVRARGRGARTVLIITGAGRGGQGVLKRRFPDWLSDPELRPIVAAFAQAHRSHGGSGAFYVFLKRK
jgi:DNA-nicking Smr family endonuclease